MHTLNPVSPALNMAVFEREVENEDFPGKLN
jgi:hypothetical protein